MKKITFEAACKKLKISAALPDVSNLPEDMQARVIAEYKLCILVKAYNGSWKANYADSSQWKYFPWFRYVPGSGWVLRGLGLERTYASVGARLALKTSELAKFVGETHIELYRDWLGEGE